MNSIKNNYTYTVIYQILLVIVPLITSPYISRVLGAENIGLYTYYLTIVNYFLLFARLGISNFGTRSIANAGSLDEKQTIFSNIFFLQTILSIIVSAIYMSYVFFSDIEYKSLGLLMLVYLISAIFDVNWFFFGIEKFKLVVSRNIFIKLLSTLLIFVFVRSEQDVFVYALILGGLNLFGQFLVWPNLIGYVKFTKPDINEILKIIPPIFVLFIPQIAVSLYKMMDKIMVGAMCEKSALGYYAYASMIVGLPLGFITSLGTVMMPRTTMLLREGKFEKSEKYFHYSIIFSVGMSTAFSFGLSGIAPVFIPLYLGDKFSPVIPLLIGLSVTIIFISWANVIRTQYLIPRKMDKEYIISLFCGAAINLFLNIILIPKYDVWGAVVGTIVAEMVVCVIQTLMIRQYISLVKHLNESLGFIVIGLIMFISLRGLSILNFSAILVVIFQIIFGIIIYVLLSYFYLSKVLKIDIISLMRQ